MKVEQIYTGCLAEAAYYNESVGGCYHRPSSANQNLIMSVLRKIMRKSNTFSKRTFMPILFQDISTFLTKLVLPLYLARLFNLLIQHTLQRMAKEFKVGNIKIKVLHTQVIRWSLLLFIDRWKRCRRMPSSLASHTVYRRCRSSRFSRKIWSCIRKI